MQYVSQSCAESKQISALRSLKLCNILPTANRKKPMQGSPSPKRSRSAPILRADLFLMQTLINPQIDSISLQYPGGHRREIKIISGFVGAVIALLSRSRKRSSSARHSEAHTENRSAITICRVIATGQISKAKQDRHSVTGKKVSLTQMSRKSKTKISQSPRSGRSDHFLCRRSAA